MSADSPLLDQAIQALSRLPGIGSKSARRLTYYLLQAPEEEVNNLARTMVDLKHKIHHCQSCFNLTEEETCTICRNPRRDQTVICVVADPKDIHAIDKTNEFKGLYHVLGGMISPLNNIGPDDLNIRALLNRLQGDRKIEELILAVNPSTEGDATMHYLSKICSPHVSRITWLARGLPIGGELEYSDEATIGRALTGRVII